MAWSKSMLLRAKAFLSRLRRLATSRRPHSPDWGNMRRLQPVSRAFGFDRGTPIDRYYIERFLRANRVDIRGRVLEIGDATYTREFGRERVTQSDVLQPAPGSSGATIIGDLAQAGCLPADAFDCFILTQTLSHIYPVRDAIRHAGVALKPGGVLLATFGGVTQISRFDMDRWGDFWRFTDASAKRLFGEVFAPSNVTVSTHGNILVVCSFLHGLAVPDLEPHELEYNDPDYPVLITVRAVKSPPEARRH